MSVNRVAKDFRIILKNFKKMPSFNNKQSSLRQIVLEKFHSGKLEKSEARVTLLRATANSYATLLSNVSELKYLRGLDSGEKLDPRDKIRATAARVGLGVPKFADDESLANELGRNMTL